MDTARRPTPWRVGLVIAVAVFSLMAAGVAMAGQAKGLSEDQAKRAVTAFLQDALKHPRGYKDLGWSKLVEHPHGGPYKYSIRHKYGFVHSVGPGGKDVPAVADQVFSLDGEGNVTGGETLKPGRTHPRNNRWRP